MGRRRITLPLLGLLCGGLVWANATYAADPGPPRLAPLPRRAPSPTWNPTTTAKVELGRLLYFDARLSGDGATSCATCHAPETGWSAGVALGRSGEGSVQWRNVPTLVGSAWLSKLGWDGASHDLEGQTARCAEGPLAGNAPGRLLEEWLADAADYAPRFKEVFGAPRPRVEHAWQAISAFVRTLNQPDTPFDRTMRGAPGGMGASARRGMKVFMKKARCVQCHSGSMLTDERFHDLGVPESQAFEKDAGRQIGFRFSLRAGGATNEIHRRLKRDPGAYVPTRHKALLGAIRTPTLRYLTHTAPYMHNGIFDTLEEVVDFHLGGGGPRESQPGADADADPGTRMKPVRLRKRERADLLDFLRALSGPPLDVKRPDARDEEKAATEEAP